MCRFVCSLVCFAFVLPGHQAPAKNRDVAMLSKAPSITGDTYQCGDIIQVVNHLRQLGKDKCLAVLRDYLAAGGEHDKVLVICRLLFVNPKGWEPPILGETVPAIGQHMAKQFPLFPIALSDRVPFLLVRGYSLKGQAESAFACVKLCDGFALVKDDYPLVGYEKAARALTQSDSFRQLYDAADRPEMADMILRQAKTKPAEKVQSD